MSYGRKPYYIYSDGHSLHFYGDGVLAAVPEEAINQFLHSLVYRGNEEINERLERGAQLRPDLGTYSVEVTKKTSEQYNTEWTMEDMCPDCGGPIMVRNPSGHCDHLYYPEYKDK